MKKLASKIIWLIVILIMAVWVAPFVVDAATSGITPKNAVDLEVGIGGFKKVEKGIAEYIGQVYLFATAIVGGLAVVMIIIGAVQYSSSAGNKAAIGSAKETMTSAIIGLVIVLMAYLILGTISGDFVNLTNPRLNVINIGNFTPTPSPSYVPPSTNNLICVSDPSGSGGVCRLNAGGVQYDPACKKIGDSCETVTPPPPPSVKDCPRRTKAECEKNDGQVECRWCSNPRGCMSLGYYRARCATHQDNNLPMY